MATEGRRAFLTRLARVSYSGKMKKIVIAEPHGFCAGVTRAIALAEKALLERADPSRPLYCLHELVHNRNVVDRLSSRGVVFVKDLSEVPDGETVLFSAHGVSPAIREAAVARGLAVLDATCVFVSKVHEAVREYAGAGCSVLLIGNRGHDEVLGVSGEAPEAVTVISTLDDAETVSVPDPSKVAVVTQTTLAVSQVEEVMAVLRRRFPLLVTPPRSGICYATTDRQQAVRHVARETGFVLVLGSCNSANSNRLVDVARSEGAQAELVPDAEAVAGLARSGRFESVESIGLTAGASTPEDIVASTVEFLRTQGFAP